jgi:hypothetical protein
MEHLIMSASIEPSTSPPELASPIVTSQVPAASIQTQGETDQKVPQAVPHHSGTLADLATTALSGVTQDTGSIHPGAGKTLGHPASPLNADQAKAEQEALGWFGAASPTSSSEDAPGSEYDILEDQPIYPDDGIRLDSRSRHIGRAERRE